MNKKLLITIAIIIAAIVLVLVAIKFIPFKITMIIFGMIVSFVAGVLVDKFIFNKDK